MSLEAKLRLDASSFNHASKSSRRKRCAALRGLQSHRDEAPVLIQKSPDQYDRSDLIQNWKNGSDFLFLDAKDDVIGEAEIS